MDRREMLGLVGAGAFGLAATGATTAHADDDHDKKHDHDHDKKDDHDHDHDHKDDHDHGHAHGHDRHIEVMAHCARTCAEAACHCVDMLKKGGDHVEKHAKALSYVASCEGFCVLSARQTAYHSPLAQLAHRANAAACDECARACEGLEGEIMKKCVEACRRCAEVCRSMGHDDHHA